MATLSVRMSRSSAGRKGLVRGQMRRTLKNKFRRKSSGGRGG